MLISSVINNSFFCIINLLVLCLHDAKREVLRHAGTLNLCLDLWVLVKAVLAELMIIDLGTDLVLECQPVSNENLLDMVQKPEWWVDNAEFNPQDANQY